MEHQSAAALIDAVKAGDEAGVARALARGADPDSKAGPFRPPVLSVAAGRGDLPIVRRLLDAGASAGSADPHTRSPLRSAVHEAHPQVAELLIAHGALDAEPTGGDSVFARHSVLADAIASTVHRPQPAALGTLRLLLRHGASTLPGENAPIVIAVMRRAAPAVLRILLTHGADASQRRLDGTPVLVVAARRGDHAAVDVLLQAGADIDAGDAAGRTALMHAIERDERAAVAVLRAAGASIGKVSADGTTALQLARGWQRQMIQFMLGERRVGLDDVPIARTVIRLHPAAYQVRGDPAMLQRWARLIERAVDSLGSAWEDATCTTAEDALAVAGRLRSQAEPEPGTSWHRLHVSGDELRVVRAALLEFAHGTPVELPQGISHDEIMDLYDELECQLVG